MFVFKGQASRIFEMKKQVTKMVWRHKNIPSSIIIILMILLASVVRVRKDCTTRVFIKPTYGLYLNFLKSCLKNDRENCVFSWSENH